MRRPRPLDRWFANAIAFYRWASSKGKRCGFPEMILKAVMCLGYMTAVIEFVLLNDADTKKPLLGICAPTGLGMPQALQVFINHARARPESWHESAPLGIMRSFSTAFPCRSG